MIDKLKMKTAEEILKSKLDTKILIANNPDYTFNKVIEAMEEYSNQFEHKQQNNKEFFDIELKKNKTIVQRFEEAIRNQNTDDDERTLSKTLLDIHEEELDLALAEQQLQMNEVAEEMATERAIEFGEWCIYMRANLPFKTTSELYSLFKKK